MEHSEKTNTIVIGAGITGLVTAFYLQQRGIDCVVIERQNQVGGVMQTKKEAGFMYEAGPNTGVLGNPEVVELFEDLGYTDHLEIADKKAKKRYVLKNDTWHPLPSGPIDGIKTHLFSWKDKFRMIGEPFRKPGKNPDERLHEMVIRRLGKSFLDYAVDPFILGIYAGDPGYLVPKYALPKLYNLEQQYGSFIKGAIHKAKERKRDPRLQKASREIFSVYGGLSQLTNKLYNRIGQENFRLGAQDVTVDRYENSYIIAYKNSTENTCTIQADNVITTTGAYEIPYLMPFLPQTYTQKISNLLYAKVIHVSVWFTNWRGMNLDAFGGLIPSKENHDILGILFLSSFLTNRAPESGALLSVFLGGVRRPEIIEKDDNEILQIVKSEVSQLLQIPVFNPDLLKINRYTHAIPQYGIESADRYQAIEKIHEQYPGLMIGGNGIGGIGIADRIKQGKDLAFAINQLSNQ